MPRVPIQPVDTKNEEVYDYFQGGFDVDSGIVHCASIIERYPESSIPYYSLAGLLRPYDVNLALRAMELASAFAARALGATDFTNGKPLFLGEKERHFLYCVYWRASDNVALGNYTLARRLFERMLVLNPRDVAGVRKRLPSLYMYFNEPSLVYDLLATYEESYMIEAQIVSLAYAVEEGRIEDAANLVGEIAEHGPMALLGIVGSIKLPVHCDGNCGIGDLEEASEMLRNLAPCASNLGPLISVLCQCIPPSCLSDPCGTFTFGELKSSPWMLESRWQYDDSLVHALREAIGSRMSTH